MDSEKEDFMNNENKEYQYTEDPLSVTRREFLTIGGVISALTAAPAVWVRSRVVKRNDYIRARSAGLYKDDQVSKVRVSHGNNAVMNMYREFAGQPLSEISEELFHTSYINRNNGFVS